MTDTAPYEASALDWNALRSLALLAAQRTALVPTPKLGYVNRATNDYTELLGPHWLLDHRMQNSEGSYSGHVEEDHTDDVYALLPDGSLVYVQVVEEIWVFPSRETPVYKDHHVIRNMTDADVQAFDHAKEHYALNGVWGDTVWAGHGQGPLLHGRKGAGLSQLLNDVLDGRVTGLPPAGSLSKFHDPSVLQRQLEAAHHRRALSTAAAQASARSSAEWRRQEERRARNRKTDKIFDRTIGAFKGGAIALVVWAILAMAVGIPAGLGVLIVVLGIVGGAMWLWMP